MVADVAFCGSPVGSFPIVRAGVVEGVWLAIVEPSAFISFIESHGFSRCKPEDFTYSVYGKPVKLFLTSDLKGGKLSDHWRYLDDPRLLR